MELEEIQAKEILSEIVALKQKIVNSQIDAHLEKCCFLAFWDFDGTVMKGDCSEGKEHFQSVLKNYYFSSSIRILEELKAVGIQSYIISASAHFFVKGMSGTLPIDGDRLFGIEVEIKNGIITPKEISPVTYAYGKREKLIQIVANLLAEKKADKVFVLAGFGNSFHTDGPFLKYIAEQKIEAGKAITVMINGGEATSEYTGIFKEVIFEHTVG